MTERIVLHPQGWKAPSGYSHGLSARGRIIALAGQIGWNPLTAQFDTDDFAGQVEQALRNVVVLLDVAGATPEHLVRLTWFITDRRAYLASTKDVGARYRTVIGNHYPAMSVVVVSALLEPRALVEIEATAVVP